MLTRFNMTSKLEPRKGREKIALTRLIKTFKAPQTPKHPNPKGPFTATPTQTSTPLALHSKLLQPQPPLTLHSNQLQLQPQPHWLSIQSFYNFRRLTWLNKTKPSNVQRPRRDLTAEARGPTEAFTFYILQDSA